MSALDDLNKAVALIKEHSYREGVAAERERCAKILESCDDFSITSSTPGPEATPEALATATCRWLVKSLASSIRSGE